MLQRKHDSGRYVIVAGPSEKEWPRKHYKKNYTLIEKITGITGKRKSETR